MISSKQFVRSSLLQTWRSGRVRKPLTLEVLEQRQLLAADPIITELMAANDSTLADGSAVPEYPDWIEIFNAGDEAAELAGWHLTDDPNFLDRWTFPSVSLAAGEYLVVFASGQNAPDAADNLHTNFGLDAAGEYVALVHPDGTTIASEYGTGGQPFPRQRSDISYGPGQMIAVTPLVRAGDTADVLVANANDDALIGSSWTRREFVPGAAGETLWITGPTGVGFEITPVLPLRVEATDPTDGASLFIAPTVMTVDFNREFDPSTVVAADLVVDGNVATDITLDDADTVTFTLPPGVDGLGTHLVAIAAGAIEATDGELIQAYQGQYKITEGITSTAVTYYHFNNGANLAENAGITSDGTVQGNITQVSGRAGLGNAGDFGTLVQAHHIDVADHPDLDPLDGPFTMAAWFKTALDDERQSIIHGRSDSSQDVILLELRDGRPEVFVRERSAFPSDIQITHPTSLADDQWHHMALTWTGGSDDTLTLYVDGVVSGSSQATRGSISIAGYQVGARYGANEHPLNGALDEIGMWNEASTPDTIAYLAAGNEIGTTQTALAAVANPELLNGLQGYWTLDDPEDLGKDATGNLDGVNMGVTVAEGRIGGGGNFGTELTNEHIQLDNSSLLTPGPDGMSISAWIKTTAGGYTNIYHDQGPHDQTAKDVFTLDVYGETGGEVEFFVRDRIGISNSKIDRSARSTTAVNDGQWHHVAGVLYGNGDIEIFIDGVSEDSSSPGTTVDLSDLSGSLAPRIGQRSDGTNPGSGSIDEVGIWNTALSMGAIADLAAGETPMVQRSLANLIETDVRIPMHGVNASAYIRMPFAVDAEADFDTLALNMKYDDGFVAYINGLEVARRNAPVLPAFNSTAEAEHPNQDAWVFEPIDVSSVLGLLDSVGVNVLAIHALNLTDDDDDFLVLPELVATKVLDKLPLYFTEPTPGSENGAGIFGFVEDTRFSVDRGFFDVPIQPGVEITSDTPGAAIYYTTDGSAPSETNGTLYTDPIPIATTTTLRAVAFAPDHLPTNVDTQTYIFLEDVIQQTGDGYPAPWGLHVWKQHTGLPVQANYEMDPEIVNDPRYSQTIIDDLRSVPTMSLVFDPDDLWDDQTGIYVNPTEEGIDWERPVSVEMIDGQGQTLFQVNAGGRIHGRSGRYPNNSVKHSIRLLFKDEYGPTKLNYPLFGPDATDSFDTVVIRSSGVHDTWATDWWIDQDYAPPYIHDQWVSAALNAMDGTAPHGTWVHLYVNGLYWGLYDPVERPDGAFAATYLGGDKDQYDVIHTGELKQGDLNSWSEFLNLIRQPQIDYAAVQGILDVPSFVDYMIVNQFAGNIDWPTSNWIATHRRVPGAKWNFHAWDSEFSLLNLNDNRLHEEMYWDGGPGEFYLALSSVEEFRMLYADRIHNHMFNDGALTFTHNLQRLNTLADTIERAIVGESARWGDGRLDEFSPPRTLDDDWLPRINWLRDTYFPQRNDIVLQQFRDIGLYPTLDAPEFFINGWAQHGGDVISSDMLIMTGQPFLDIDTVISEGSIARWRVPTDNLLGLTWVDQSFDYNLWPIGTVGIGYEDTPADYQNLIQTTVRPTDSCAECTSIFVRIPFDMTDLNDIAQVTLKMKYDDAFVAYINGVEVARSLVNGTPPAYDATAITDHPDVQAAVFEHFDLTPFVNELDLEDNVLAIHAVDVGTTSSDLLILPQLEIGRTFAGSGDPTIYYTTDGSDPRLSTNDINDAVHGGTAVDFTGPLTLNQSQLVKARGLVNGNWSALTEALFAVNTPTTDQLMISEINYNPAAPTAAESASILGVGNDDFEFIEMYNAHPSDTIQLLGMQLTGGVDFSFPDAQLLPGQYALVVEDTAAFQERYGYVGYILGQWSGRLSNSGEQLTLLDGGGNFRWQIDYGDSDPWPERADGSGGTIQLIDHNNTPVAELGKWYRWRGSTEFHGSPGTSGQAPIGVVINEVLAHTDPPVAQSDSIELYNPTAAPIDITGWWLSDADNNLLKYQIPGSTILNSGQYIIFDEDNFNPTLLTPGPNDFALSGTEGDDVWLVISDGSGGVQSFVDDVHFSATPNGESFGRDPNGRGRLAPQDQLTIGSGNGAVRVGPAVVSELNYNPGTPSAAALAIDPALTSNDLEFIEIHNPTGAAVDLTDWRIRGGADFDFAPDTMLAAGETVLVISFNPDNAANVTRVSAFRAHYGIDGSVRLLGGSMGQLNNSSELVLLQRPGTPVPESPTLIPRLEEDAVLYDDLAPWSDSADGLGETLHRTRPGRWGSEADSWTAGIPGPGAIDRLGDTDLDTDVDTSDLTTAIINFTSAGGAGKTWNQGDTDGDGDIDTSDLTTAIINFTGAMSSSLASDTSGAVTFLVTTIEKNREVNEAPSSSNHRPNANKPTTRHPSTSLLDAPLSRSVHVHSRRSPTRLADLEVVFAELR